jgi:hypothetical protein
MENFRTDEEILSGITEFYGTLGTQTSMIVGAFTKGVNWSDNHPRKGLVNIERACEWLDNNAEDYTIDGGLSIENLIYSFKKAMGE